MHCFLMPVSHSLSIFFFLHFLLWLSFIKSHFNAQALSTNKSIRVYQELLIFCIFLKIKIEKQQIAWNNDHHISQSNSFDKYQHFIFSYQCLYILTLKYLTLTFITRSSFHCNQIWWNILGHLLLPPIAKYLNYWTDLQNKLW